MLSEFERQMCRDYKKRLDVQRTPAGHIALKMAQPERRERERRADILKKYTEPPASPVKKEPEINPILKQYMSK